MRCVFQTILILAGIFVGIVIGISINSRVQARSEPESPIVTEKQSVTGHGRAFTSWEHSEIENITFSLKSDPHRPFSTVPKGKKLIITDVVYHPQRRAIETITVNLAESDRGNRIMFQIAVNPRESEVVNFCTGYVIDAGKSVKAYTDANAKDGQWVSLSISGYLTEE